LIKNLALICLASPRSSVAPLRLDRTRLAINCDNNNAYAAEQAALDDRLMDKFPENTSAAATDAINADLTQSPGRCARWRRQAKVPVAA